MQIQLTIKEAKLVSDLMELYYEALQAQVNNHEFDCMCGFCQALDKVGNCHTADWKSLQTKTNQDK